MSSHNPGGGEAPKAHIADRKEERSVVKVFTLEELLAQKEILQKYISCFRAVFDQEEATKYAPQEERLQWEGENWSEEAVAQMLQEHAEKAGNESLVTMLFNEKEEAVAFTYGTIVSGAEQITDFPKSYSGRSDLHVDKDELVGLIRNQYPEAKNFLSLREMGVRGDERAKGGGMKRIFSIVIPLFMAAIQKEAKHFVFWTSKNSNLYRIAVGSGFDLIKDFADEEQHVYMGADLLKLVANMSKGAEKFKKDMKS